MKVVAAVVGGQEMVGVRGIADDCVEVDDGVEVAGVANPGVDGLAIGFAQGAGVVVVGASVGRDRGSIDAKLVGVGARDDLLIGAEDSLDESGVFFGGDFPVAGEAAEVVDAFENDDPTCAGGCEDVAIEAREGVGAEAVGEEMIAADALVGDADGLSTGRLLQVGGEGVGPAGIAVGDGSVTVGDGVAESDDGGGGGGGLDVYF